MNAHPLHQIFPPTQGTWSVFAIKHLDQKCKHDYELNKTQNQQ